MHFFVFFFCNYAAVMSLCEVVRLWRIVCAMRRLRSQSRIKDNTFRRLFVLLRGKSELEFLVRVHGYPCRGYVILE